MTIRAALFDVFGTCVDWRTGVAAFAAPLLVERGLPETLGSKLADLWRTRYDPSMQTIRAGERAYVPLDILQRENLDDVLDALGVAELFDASERDLLNAAWTCLPAWPDTTAALGRLKKTIPIAACSNGSFAMMEELAEHAQLPWTQICGAQTARNFKPHPSVYLQSCQALNTPPEHTIMVACHADDLDAAKQLGLLTAYVPRPHEHGDVPFAPDPDPGRFTIHGNSLPDIVDKIVANAQS